MTKYALLNDMLAVKIDNEKDFDRIKEKYKFARGYPILVGKPPKCKILDNAWEIDYVWR